MKKVRINFKWVLIVVCCAIAWLSASDSSAEITATDLYRAEALPDPNPPVYIYQPEIAYYNNYLIYAGDDRNIYAYDLTTKSSTLVSDTSSLTPEYYAVSGFMVSSDDYLYFHDQGQTSNIYRLKLTDPWPASPETLNTGITSSIVFFTENPLTHTIWFSSSDFYGTGNNFHLYEINPAFTTATEKSFFARPHDSDGTFGSGNGPILFENETTLLYGESIYVEVGHAPCYFHRVNTATGAVEEDYLIVERSVYTGVYGYNNHIYVTSGQTNSILEIDGTQQTLIATTDDSATGLTFDGTSLFISEMVPFSEGNDDVGKTSRVSQLWRVVPADQQVDDTVDLNADGVPDNQQLDVILAVNTAGGSGAKQIGVSPVGTTAVVESLESVAASTIDETANRPTDFPFDLVNYRLTVTSTDGTAQVIVYLSEPAPADARWYKYDAIGGWTDYSEHATFSADRQSVTLALKDGEYGDLDGIVNGEIIDPGGVGVTTSTTPPLTSGGGGGGGGCFIDSAGSAVLYQSHPRLYLLLASALCFGTVTLARRLTKQ
jgi:hypothetical protein